MKVFFLDVHLSIVQALSLSRCFGLLGLCPEVFLLVRNLRGLLPLSPPRVKGGGSSVSWGGKCMLPLVSIRIVFCDVFARSSFSLDSYSLVYIQG